MTSNKENRSPSPKNEGEKHQGVGVNTPAKESAGPKSKDESKTENE